MEQFAAQRGMRYEPDADERWLRAWEPYTTLKTPNRYEHILEATGGSGSISLGRAVVELPVPAQPNPMRPTEVGTWIAIVQDERITVKAATTNDFGGIFGESLEIITTPRKATGDAAFDHTFASFADTRDDLDAGLTPSVRKLLLSWRVPVHAELRPGGFVIAPVSLGADERGLGWLLSAIHLFGEKATKRAT